MVRLDLFTKELSMRRCVFFVCLFAAALLCSSATAQGQHLSIDEAIRNVVVAGAVRKGSVILD